MLLFKFGFYNNLFLLPPLDAFGPRQRCLQPGLGQSATCKNVKLWTDSTQCMPDIWQIAWYIDSLSSLSDPFPLGFQDPLFLCHDMILIDLKSRLIIIEKAIVEALTLCVSLTVLICNIATWVSNRKGLSCITISKLAQVELRSCNTCLPPIC